MRRECRMKGVEGLEVEFAWRGRMVAERAVDAWRRAEMMVRCMFYCHVNECVWRGWWWLVVWMDRCEVDVSLLLYINPTHALAARGLPYSCSCFTPTELHNLHR